jgi:hypothetical protein
MAYYTNQPPTDEFKIRLRGIIEGLVVGAFIGIGIGSLIVYLF